MHCWAVTSLAPGFLKTSRQIKTSLADQAWRGMWHHSETTRQPLVLNCYFLKDSISEADAAQSFSYCATESGESQLSKCLILSKLLRRLHVHQNKVSDKVELL